MDVVDVDVIVWILLFDHLTRTGRSFDVIYVLRDIHNPDALHDDQVIILRQIDGKKTQNLSDQRIRI